MASFYIYEGMQVFQSGLTRRTQFCKIQVSLAYRKFKVSEYTFRKRPNTKFYLIASAMLAGLLLSGCTGGGTTYGTGVGQEKQTLTDLTEMLTFKKKRTIIDYSARPDLIVPDQKQLVNPIDQISTANNEQWPESPEQRIARIRAAADEAQATNRSRVEFSKSRKKVASNVRKLDTNNEAPNGQGVPNISCDPDGLVMRQCTDAEMSKAFKDKIKQKKAGFTKQRRYLTEPPNDYLKPSDTAVIGDEGFTEKELAKIEELKKLKREEQERNAASWTK